MPDPISGITPDYSPTGSSQTVSGSTGSPTVIAPSTGTGVSVDSTGFSPLAANMTPNHDSTSSNNRSIGQKIGDFFRNIWDGIKNFFDPGSSGHGSPGGSGQTTSPGATTSPSPGACPTPGGSGQTSPGGSGQGPTSSPTGMNQAIANINEVTSSVTTPAYPPPDSQMFSGPWGCPGVPPPGSGGGSSNADGADLAHEVIPEP